MMFAFAPANICPMLFFLAPHLPPFDVRIMIRTCGEFRGTALHLAHAQQQLTAIVRGVEWRLMRTG